MNNYRYQYRTAGGNKPGRQKNVRGWIILVIAIIIIVFFGRLALVRNHQSTNSSKNNSNSSDDIQTVESLLKNANVNINTNANSNANSNTNATASSKATVCDKAYSYLPTTEKVVALTFDSSGINDRADAILTILKNSSVPAFFFPTGTFVDGNETVLQKISSAGIGIGNHSNTHADFKNLTLAQMAKEINDASTKIDKVLGKSETKYFRPPFGSLGANNEAITASKNEGYCTILWSIDAKDWEQTATPQTVVSNVQKGLKPGAIIMMQFGYDTVEQSLPSLIQTVKNAGYSFVSLTNYFTPPSL